MKNYSPIFSLIFGVFMLFFFSFVQCRVGNVSSAGKDYMISDIRMNYSSAEMYCKAQGSQIAQIPSTRREEVGTFIYASKSGPTSVWAIFEGLKPANESFGCSFSANNETLATPSGIATNNFLYALCERKS